MKQGGIKGSIRPERLKELDKLPIGTVLKKLNRGAWEIIIGSNLVIVSSARITLIHYEGTPEYIVYRTILNEDELLTEQELDDFIEVLFVYPMVYTYMYEDAEFGSKTMVSAMEFMAKRLEEASKEIEDNPEEGERYISDQKIVDAVLNHMEVETEHLRMKTKTSYVSPERAKRKTTKKK
jgi:hypothetical protein